MKTCQHCGKLFEANPTSDEHCFECWSSMTDHLFPPLKMKGPIILLLVIAGIVIITHCVKG